MENIHSNIEHILDKNLLACYPDGNIYHEKAHFEICNYFSFLSNTGLQFTVYSDMSGDTTEGTATVHWVEDGDLHSVVFKYYTPLHEKVIELGGKS